MPLTQTILPGRGQRAASSFSFTSEAVHQSAWRTPPVSAARTTRLGIGLDFVRPDKLEQHSRMHVLQVAFVVCGSSAFELAYPSGKCFNVTIMNREYTLFSMA